MRPTDEAPSSASEAEDGGTAVAAAAASGPPPPLEQLERAAEELEAEIRGKAAELGRLKERIEAARSARGETDAASSAAAAGRKRKVEEEEDDDDAAVCVVCDENDDDARATKAKKRRRPRTTDPHNKPKPMEHPTRKYVYQCILDGCPNEAMGGGGGYCYSHGGGRYKKRKGPRPTCSVDGCDRKVRKAGLCCVHGEPRPSTPCRVEGCARMAITLRDGVCIKHGAKVKRYFCAREGCDKQVARWDVCFKHGAKCKDFPSSRVCDSSISERRETRISLPFFLFPVAKPKPVPRLRQGVPTKTMPRAGGAAGRTVRLVRGGERQNQARKKGTGKERESLGRVAISLGQAGVVGAGEGAGGADHGHGHLTKYGHNTLRKARGNPRSFHFAQNIVKCSDAVHNNCLRSGGEDRPFAADISPLFSHSFGLQLWADERNNPCYCTHRPTQLQRRCWNYRPLPDIDFLLGCFLGVV